MALSVKRFTLQYGSTVGATAGLWVVAILAMASLSACIYLLLPEESFAVAAGLLVLLVAVGDLRYGFLTFVFIYPFLPITWGIDVADWMPHLTAERLCCIGLALVFLVQGKGAWDTPRVRWISWLLVALVLMQIVAGFGSRDPLGAVKRTFGDVVGYYFPFLIAAHLFRTRAQVRTLFFVAALAMAISAVLAIVEHSIDYNFYDTFVATREDIRLLLAEGVETHRGGDLHARRVRVAFPHPIEMGLHLMFAVIVAAFFIRHRSPFARLGLAVALPLYLLALLYTYSRGPMLGLICGVVWFCLVGRGMRSLLPVMLMCGVAVYLLMPSSGRQVLDATIATSTDIETGNSLGGGTVRGRLDLMEAGLQLSRQNLWFGLGPGGVKEQGVTGTPGHRVDFSSVDNYYLLVLLRHGLVTLILTGAFYIYLLALFSRGAFVLVDQEAARLSSVAAALCVANFVALATVGFNVTLFWILLGPAIRAYDLYQPPSRRRGSSGKNGDRETTTMLTPLTARQEMSERVPVAAGRFAVPLKISARTRAYGLSLSLLALPSLAQAAPSFYGTTGLFATPTAAVAPRGAWSAGANYVSRNFRPGASSISNGTVAHTFTMTLVPRVELAALINNYEGRLGARNLDAGPTPDKPLAGYTTDRMVAMHWLAAKQHGSRPAIAFGIRDIFGTVQPLKAQYGVASWKLTPLGEARPVILSAGLGAGLLKGPFGGAEIRVAPRATLILEGLTGQVNGGVRMVPLKNFQLDAALMGFRSLGGGLSYRRRF